MCTVIRMNSPDGFLLGKNNDNFLHQGMLFSNRKGIRKQALIAPPDTPLHWVSTYGGMSFSQCGKELPVGGMNEAGLVVEQTTLPETRYPEYRGGAAVGELQVIQYLLDTCADVAEALQALSEVEIRNPTWPLQYVLADGAGDMAIVEYLNGGMSVIRGERLRIKAVANSRYDKAMACRLEGTASFTDAYEANSMQRFATAAELLESMDPNDATTVFSLLERVKRPDTVWQVVYDMNRRAIHLRTAGNARMKSLSVQSVDYRPEAVDMMLPLNHPSDGEGAWELTQYDRGMNRALVHGFFHNELVASVMGISLPDAMLAFLSEYPDTLEPMA